MMHICAMAMAMAMPMPIPTVNSGTWYHHRLAGTKLLLVTEAHMWNPSIQRLYYNTTMLHVWNTKLHHTTHTCTHTNLDSNTWWVDAVPKWYTKQTELCRPRLESLWAASTYHTATWYTVTSLDIMYIAT